MKEQLVNALKTKYDADYQMHKANLDIYLNNPVGIGEHPDVLGAIQDQLDIIAHEEERIEVITKHFDA